MDQSSASSSSHEPQQMRSYAAKINQSACENGLGASTVPKITSQTIWKTSVWLESTPSCQHLGYILPCIHPANNSEGLQQGGTMEMKRDFSKDSSATMSCILFLKTILQLPQMVGDELDEATQMRMQQRAEELSQKMTWMLQELEQRTEDLEQKTEEPSSFDWGALLFAASRQWWFWVIAAVPALVFGLCWPVQNLTTDGIEVRGLVHDYITVFRQELVNSFLPVPQRAFEVGSAFEGWSPHENDVTYHVFVPRAPPGFSFHLEPCAVGQTLARNFRVRVDLECICRPEQLVNRQCYLHHSTGERRRNWDPSVLDILCTDSYLDSEKTALWFHHLPRDSWRALPLSSRCRLRMPPSRRSGKFQLRKGSKVITIEMMFGVQQGMSDIFVSSQSTKGRFTPSTTWPESYAVAETKFFTQLALQAPPDSPHLRCLQVCARILVGTGFSTYALKTVVMHLLTTIPLRAWRRRYFLEQLEDIMQYYQPDNYFLGALRPWSMWSMVYLR
ncbi:LOW QUALITY PROTEIN: inositol 1,4,5-trisphosphate receptor-interacting protein-like 1 [Podargus strigoides]